MVLSAQLATAVSSPACEAFVSGPAAGANSPHCPPEPHDTGGEPSKRCFLHELQDELIHLLVTFLGTPTQGSVLLGVRMPSLWRYSCGEDLPVRPALLLLSSLSCGSRSSPNETSSPASVLDEALLSPRLLKGGCGPSCPRRNSTTAHTIAAYGGFVSCNKCLSLDQPSSRSMQPLLQVSAPPESLLATRPSRLKACGATEETCDTVLSVALEKAGVPSGGQCWRGKYFFKHALERKFTRGQFDLQHTWFPDNLPLRMPRVPPEIWEKHSPQHAFRGGENNVTTCHPSYCLPRNWTLRKHLHQQHPGHLCPYRYPLFLVRRACNHSPTTVRKVTRNIVNCAADSFVTGAAAVPPVCVVGMKFFGDGVGLIYAARAGGVGACCPDSGYTLRSFTLHAADGGTRRQRQGEEKVHIVKTVPHPGLKDEVGCPRSSCTRKDIHESFLLDEAAASQQAARGHDARSARDLSAERLPTSQRGPTSQRTCPLAVCVAHTIDEALCSGSRDCPLVLAGFSDGKVGVWDYRRPQTLLECIDITHAGTRGSVAIKSLCVIKGGPAGGAEVLAGADDGRVSLLNIERPDAGVIQRLRGHTAAIQAISVHPEKGLGFTASRDRYVHLYDLRASEMPVASCGRHQDWAMCVQMREGLGANTFDTADRAVHSWDIRHLLSYSKAGENSTARPLSEQHRHRRLISGLRSDAFRLVSCSLDGTVLVSSVEHSHPYSEHDKAGGMSQLGAQPYTDFTVLRKEKDRQWLLGVDFAETKMATAAADGGIQIFHFLQLPSLPECCLYN